MKIQTGSEPSRSGYFRDYRARAINIALSLCNLHSIGFSVIVTVVQKGHISGRDFRAFSSFLQTRRSKSVNSGFVLAAVPNRTLRVAVRVLNTINTNKRIWIFFAEIFTIQVAL